jgi:single-stranded DNA-binding protein
VVTGALRAHSWKNEQGEERSGLEIDAQAVGFDLSRGKAVQERTTPLAVTSDPGPRPVDEPQDELDDDDVSVGEAVSAPPERPRRGRARCRRLARPRPRRLLP